MALYLISRFAGKRASSAVIPLRTRLLVVGRLATASFSTGRSSGPPKGSVQLPEPTSTKSDPPEFSDRPEGRRFLPPTELSDPIFCEVGCDFCHWLIVMEQPQDYLTRDEIIDNYIKTLAAVVGSEEEARMKIYSVSTRHYYAIGALVSEDLACKIRGLPNVKMVIPDAYLDIKNKDYGGEPFINGQAVPYDPKYHDIC